MSVCVVNAQAQGIGNTGLGSYACQTNKCRNQKYQVLVHRSNDVGLLWLNSIVMGWANVNQQAIA